MTPSALVAIGGNSLIPPGEPAGVETERHHLIETCRGVAEMAARGWRLVVTHGNGPQVGAALLRSERSAGDVYPLPLDACVAATQGEIGCLLQQELGAALLGRGLSIPVVAVLAQVVVAPVDPAFLRPSKPVGPF